MKEKHFELYFKSSLAFKKLHVEYIKRICSCFDELVANVYFDLGGIIHIYAISLYDKELDDLEQVKYEVEQIKQVVQEVKMLVRKLNDEFEKR